MIIEEELIGYLSGRFNAYMEKPQKPPKRYVLIEKTGGSVSNQIKQAVIAIQSYAESLVSAAELNEQVKDYMDDFDTRDNIGSCELASDYNYTDTTTKEYRYQAVYNITHY